MNLIQALRRGILETLVRGKPEKLAEELKEDVRAGLEKELAAEELESESKGHASSSSSAAVIDVQGETVE